MKKEQLCKMKDEVEFGAGGSKKNKVVAKLYHGKQVQTRGF